jgi:hypothetical protein
MTQRVMAKVTVPDKGQRRGLARSFEKRIVLSSLASPLQLQNVLYEKRGFIAYVTLNRPSENPGSRFVEDRRTLPGVDIGNNPCFGLKIHRRSMAKLQIADVIGAYSQTSSHAALDADSLIVADHHGVSTGRPSWRSAPGQEPEWLVLAESVSRTPRTGPFFCIAANSPLCQQETHAPQQIAALFDHLIGADKQGGWHCKAERLGGF